jgi:transcriptional regulator with XRE-family HTH domain
MTITPGQCRAARALLGWSRRQLSQSAQIAERTLVDFERGARRPLNRTLADVRRALEEAGIIFIDEDDEGPGVRLRKGQMKEPN